jgi:hypothetical protein
MKRHYSNGTIFRYLFILFGVVGLFLLLMQKGVAMTFFKKEEVVLASPFEAKLTLNGKPVDGAKVTRQLQWTEKVDRMEETWSDNSGNFKFPAALEKLRIPALSQFVINQTITVNVDNKEYVIWLCGKMEEKLYGETGVELRNIICDLSKERERVDSLGFLSTSCVWDKPDNGDQK